MKFEIPVLEVDWSKYEKVKKQMEWFLFNISNNIISVNDIKETTYELIGKQRSDLVNPVSYSWCIPENCNYMPLDVKIKMIYEPTFIAVSILVYIKQHFKDFTENISGFDEGLKNGLYFSSLRGFLGHGYNRYGGMNTAFMYFAAGEVIEFVKTNPGYAKSFYKALVRLCESNEEILERGGVMFTWEVEEIHILEKVNKLIKNL